MAAVVLFHHVLGLTEGVRNFAERLAGPDHTVYVPDLYAGHVADNLEEGFALKNSIGDDALADRVEQALEPWPGDLVYAGISLGVMTAQRLAQTRAGARGALLYEACLPITGDWAFGPWPSGVPVQIHGMDDDQFFAHEGDVEAARQIVETVGPDQASLHLYPGSSHLFTDDSLPSYDAAATDLVLERSRAFLNALG